MIRGYFLSLLVGLVASSPLTQTTLAAGEVRGELPRRAHVGIGLAPVPNGESGAVISFLSPNGPGAESGLLPGDRVIRAGENEIKSNEEFIGLIKGASEGGDMPLKLVRDGAEMDLVLHARALPLEDHPNVEVIYDSVDLGDARLRSIVLKPEGDGPFPAIFMIQGLNCVSIEALGSKESFLWQVPDRLAQKGFVVFRVEKSGMGDSTGAPCPMIDFEEEMDGYREGLRAVKAYPFVDAENVFMFGHSMGGVFAPLLARESAVRGIAVYGTGVRPWVEYMIENARRQAVLAGGNQLEVDEAVRNEIAFQTRLCVMKMDGREIYKQNPELKDPNNPNDTGEFFQTRRFNFFHQLADQNMVEAWSDLDTNVLSGWGQADFVSAEEDHRLLAEVVNAAAPGKGRFEIVPNSDHGFFTHGTFKESMEARFTGDFNPTFTDMMADWAHGLVSKE
jgi:dienelactone hydrolase